MVRAVSQGVMLTVNMAQSPFIQKFETSITGRQPQDVTDQDATDYSLHPRDAVVTAELSKIEQIVEYLKVLYR